MMKFFTAITAFFLFTFANGDTKSPALITERHEDVLKILKDIKVALSKVSVDFVVNLIFIMLLTQCSLLFQHVTQDLCWSNGTLCVADHCCGYCEGSFKGLLCYCHEKKKIGEECCFNFQCKSGRCDEDPFWSASYNVIKGNENRQKQHYFWIRVCKMMEKICGAWEIMNTASNGALKVLT